MTRKKKRRRRAGDELEEIHLRITVEAIELAKKRDVGYIR